MDDDRPSEPPLRVLTAGEGASKQRKHQVKRRNEGLCGYEGCPVYSGRRYYCTEHRRARRKYRSVQ